MLNLLWDIATLAAFSCWLAATVAHSFGIGSKLERHFGVLAQLLPGWNFFAPTPGTADYFLLYRDYHGDTSEPTPWREVQTLSPSRTKLAWLWNPEKLRTKSFFDMVQAIGMECRGRNCARDKMLQLSVPYLHLLNYVTGLPRWPTPQATQFFIMVQESRGQEPAMMMVSAVHRIAR